MGEWNADLYDSKHGFVAEYGRGLLEFVPKNGKQRILDLGCGTGVLTAQLAELAGSVVGVDSSEGMIERAASRYPGIRFEVCDALALPFEECFDVVFSNAVFHWIPDHDALLGQVSKALAPGGLLICEFGANGNIATIERALAAACRDFGYEYRSRFNFPTSDRFADLLVANGFVIDEVRDYDRPTPLADGEQGLSNWMRQFFASDLESMPEAVRDKIVRKVEDATRGALWDGSEWVADYRRLRAVARKGGGMRLYEVGERDPRLAEELLRVWEASVRATHTFLSDAEVGRIKGYVPSALEGVERLIVAGVESPVAFMGIEGARLEMLFVAPEERGRGLGGRLLRYGIDERGVRETTVNEQNPQAVGFYEHMGFEVYKRTDQDEEGGPYPLLYMRLR